MTTQAEEVSSDAHPQLQNEAPGSDAKMKSRRLILPELKQVDIRAVVPSCDLELCSAFKHRVILSNCVLQMELLSLSGVRVAGAQNNEYSLDVCGGLPVETLWNDQVRRFCQEVMRHLIVGKNRADLFACEKMEETKLSKLSEDEVLRLLPPMEAPDFNSRMSLTFDEHDKPLRDLNKLVRKTGWYLAHVRLVGFDVAGDCVYPIFDCVGVSLTDKSITEQEVAEEQNASERESDEMADRSRARADQEGKKRCIGTPISDESLIRNGRMVPPISPQRETEDGVFLPYWLIGAVLISGMGIGFFGCYRIFFTMQTGLVGDVYVYEFGNHEEMAKALASWRPDELCEADTSSLRLMGGAGHLQSLNLPMRRTDTQWINSTFDSAPEMIGIPAVLPTGFKVVHWHGYVFAAGAGLYRWEVESQHRVAVQVNGRVIYSTIPNVEQAEPQLATRIGLNPGWQSVDIWCLQTTQQDLPPPLRISWKPANTTSYRAFVPVDRWYHTREHLDRSSFAPRAQFCLSLLLLKEQQATLTKLNTSIKGKVDVVPSSNTTEPDQSGSEENLLKGKPGPLPSDPSWSFSYALRHLADYPVISNDLKLLCTTLVLAICGLYLLAVGVFGLYWLVLQLLC